MGAAFSEPCCGTNRRAMEELVPPLRSISVLEDDRVHFLNDSPMCCLVRNSLWEQSVTAIKDVNGTTLFHVNCSPGMPTQLILPTGSCHADVAADNAAGCWHVHMGRERRVTIKRHMSSDNQLVFLVHALKHPYPLRDTPHIAQTPLPLPCLSVRGEFFAREYSVFDCTGLDARRVARSAKWLPEKGSDSSTSGQIHAIDISAGVDVALVLCLDLAIDDFSRQAGAGKI